MISTPTRPFPAVAMILSALAAGLPVAETYAQVNNLADLEEPEVIHLYVGRSTIVQTDWPVQTVSVTDPTIADVQVLRADKVLVMGKAVGSTDIILMSDEGEAVWQARIDIDVDVFRIKAELNTLFPDCSLDARQSEDVVIVTGTLARAEQIQRVHSFLDANGVNYVDLTELAGVQQVLVQVRIAEASRTALRTLGMNALFGGHHDNGMFGASLVGTSSGGALNPVSIGPAAGSRAGFENVPFTFNADVTVSPLVTLLAGFPRADLEFFIQALAENTYLRILAEPNLVALSGQEASFLAGGEFPIPVVQDTGGGGGGTSITIEYKEFGVRLSFRPEVLGDNTIRLQVAPEVSSLSDTGAVEIQGFRVPALVTRRTETTLELKSGQTFAVAGLLSETNEGRTSRVPGLGDLPVIGALFRSTRYEKGETELVVLVTASLVEPLSTATDQPLPGTLHVPPNDWDLYAMGAIEGNPPPKVSPEAAAWYRGLGLDRLRGPGAWATFDDPGAEARPAMQQPSAPNDAETEKAAPTDDTASSENVTFEDAAALEEDDSPVSEAGTP